MCQIPGLCDLDTSNTTTQLWQPELFPDIAKSPCRGEEGKTTELNNDKIPAVHNKDSYLELN